MKKCVFMTRGGLYSLGIALLALCFGQCSDDDGPDMKAPILTVEAATNVTRTTADVSGIIDANGNKIGECGFLYSEAKSDLTNEENESAQKKVVSGQSGTVKVRLDGLKPDATYYYCLYARSGKTQIRSEILSFKTEAQGVPILNDIELIEAGEYSLKVRCSIAGDGGANIQQFGFEYRKINETSWKAIYTETYDESSSNVFTMTIDGLDPGATYVVRGVAKNSKGTGYSSNEGQYQTNVLMAPTVSLQAIDDANIGSNWVMAIGKVEDKGASDEILERGFCWSTKNEKPTIADSKLEVNADADQFSATITDLNQETRYYLRAYAANKVDGKTQYGYSEVVMFTTKTLARPVLGDVQVEVSASGAMLSCEITQAGTCTILERGFCWSKTNREPTLSDNLLTIAETESDFKALMNDLDEQTQYFVRAYVKTLADGKEMVDYSSNVADFYFREYERPSFDNLKATDITLTSAKLNAVIAPGKVAIREKGFCYGQHSEPTVADNKVVVTGNAFEAVITGLVHSTHYYYRAYAICEIGSKEEIVYSYYTGDFSTLSYKAPTLSLDYPTEIGLYSATLSAGVTNNGDGTLVEYGFCWSATEQDPQVETGKHDGLCKLENGADFTYTLTDLKPGTNYYVRAYVKTAIGTETLVGYSNTQSFWTRSLEKASINTPNVSNVTEHSFTVATSLWDAGNTEITEVGFCWSTVKDQKPEELEKHKVSLADDGKSFTLNAEGLASGTIYYVYAYATNEAGTAYSSYRKVTTKKIPTDDDNVSPDKIK